MNIAVVTLGLLAAVVFAAPAVGSEPGTRTFETPTFFLSLPGSWFLIPTHRAEIPALAKRLKAQGKGQLAAQYMSVYRDPKFWGSPSFVFSAFERPSTGGLANDLEVGMMRLPSEIPTARRKELRVIAESVVNQLRQGLGPGSRIAAPVYVSFPAGDAFRCEGVAPLGKSNSASRVHIFTYLIVSHRRMYEFVFRSSAGAAGQNHSSTDALMQTLQFK
jgi:hypothetical protein